jgi:ABC-2 type transport system ATP-binding protein
MARAMEMLHHVARLHATPSTPTPSPTGSGSAPAAARPTAGSPAGSSGGSRWPSRWSAAPELVFLDEPTAGLDPQARHATWELVEDLRRDGVTVVLTTHYMEEAERLADTVAVVDGGRVVAHGTPAELVAGAEDGVRFNAPPAWISGRWRRRCPRAARAARRCPGPTW